MRKSVVLSLALGIFLALAGLASAAAVVDIVQAPTGFFVPTDGQKYDTPYYRWYNEDWGWSHNAIAGTITSATLYISAFDVDNDGTPDGEWDAVFAYDDGVKTFLGYLTGVSDQWSYGNTFTLGSEFFNDINAGLEVFVDIDTGHTYDNWALTLAKSVISVDGGVVPEPEPGTTVPEPATTLLLGAGLVGIGLLKKRVSK